MVPHKLKLHKNTASQTEVSQIITPQTENSQTGTSQTETSPVEFSQIETLQTEDIEIETSQTGVLQTGALQTGAPKTLSSKSKNKLKCFFIFSNISEASKIKELISKANEVWKIIVLIDDPIYVPIWSNKTINLLFNRHECRELIENELNVEYRLMPNDLKKILDCILIEKTIYQDEIRFLIKKFNKKRLWNVKDLLEYNYERIRSLEGIKNQNGETNLGGQQLKQSSQELMIFLAYSGLKNINFTLLSNLYRKNNFSDEMLEKDLENLVGNGFLEIVKHESVYSNSKNVEKVYMIKNSVKCRLIENPTNAAIEKHKEIILKYLKSSFEIINENHSKKKESENQSKTKKENKKNKIRSELDFEMFKFANCVFRSSLNLISPERNELEELLGLLDTFKKSYRVMHDDYDYSLWLHKQIVEIQIYDHKCVDFNKLILKSQEQIDKILIFIKDILKDTTLSHFFK